MTAIGDLRRYQIEIGDVLKSVFENQQHAYKTTAAVLAHAYNNSLPVFVFGNGGSAAVANHWVCDHTKGINSGTRRLTGVKSLCSDIELITAIANDVSYEAVFSEQIRLHDTTKRGVAVAMSVSGSSPNVLMGLNEAYGKGHATIALVGRDGGVIKAQDVAQHVLHFPSDNYGVVEDCFSIAMHSLAQTYINGNL